MKNKIKINSNKVRKAIWLIILLQSYIETVKKMKEELKTINKEAAIEDNYNIKITKYNKEMYKKGFIDGVNLMINCLNSKEK